jgi:hypothetical protein
MAGSINYLYDPNQSVYVIERCNPDDAQPTAVRPGTVIQVRGEVLVTATNLFYDVQVDGQSGTTEFIEADVFADLASAVAEYELRLS